MGLIFLLMFVSSIYLPGLTVNLSPSRLTGLRLQKWRPSLGRALGLLPFGGGR